MAFGTFLKKIDGKIKPMSNFQWIRNEARAGIQNPPQIDPSLIGQRIVETERRIPNNNGSVRQRIVENER